MNTFLNRFNIALAVVYIAVVLPLWGGFLKESTPAWPGFSAISRALSGERRHIREQSDVKLLNLLMPPQFSDLAALSQSRRDPKSVDLAQYNGYFRQAALVLPAPLRADADAMQGFCYFHQGKTKEAYDSYLKALEENPAFLWTYTNLAFLQFKEGDYAKAAMLLTQGLKINPEDSLKAISSSKIYSDILRDIPGGIHWPSELKDTYSQAARMLVLSLYRMGQFPQTVETAQYAISAGFEPTEFFYYYAGLALNASGEHEKAKNFLGAVTSAAQQTDVFTGQDFSVRIF
jgi:tetratricopeptide (TPR) repeat protein